MPEKNRVGRLFLCVFFFLLTNSKIQTSSSNKINAAKDCPLVFYSLTHQKDMNLYMARKFNDVVRLSIDMVFDALLPTKQYKYRNQTCFYMY